MGAGYTGIFPVAAQVGGDKLYAVTNKATTADVQASMNDGRAIVAYSGHGDYTFWVGPHFDGDNIRQITQTEALPYVLSHACIAGSFGYSQDSFGEIWLKEPRGAIAFWGTTNSSYWDEDDVLERAFFEGLFKKGLRRLSATNLYALQGLRTFYNNAGNTQYYYEIYNLLGDPSVALLMDKPQ